VLRGNKRWIGNGNGDYLVVYGNLKEGGKSSVVGAIVDTKTKGITTTPIPKKYALRIVQNCQIEFDSVQLPFFSLLPKATSYKEGVEKVLKHSRIIVIWNAIGGCIGVYKSAL
jgi:alkylation response protein AidB-like acyl-CoA dehydrogenase